MTPSIYRYHNLPVLARFTCSYEFHYQGLHCKAGEANTSLKTASCEAGPGTTLTHSYESYIWSLPIQDFDDGCYFPNSICDLPKYHLY
jgi:hypothetical protein